MIRLLNHRITSYNVCYTKLLREIANLPKVYGSSDSKKENNNSTKKESSYNKSNNVKTSNSLQIKQADARQKIEFYKSKQKSKAIRNNFVNVTRITSYNVCYTKLLLDLHG